MKKKIIIVFTAILVISTLVFLLFNIGKKNKDKYLEESLSIVSVKPADNAKNVDPSTTIEIVFNKPITLTDINFSITPKTQYSLKVNEKILTIIPERLSKATQYRYTVSYPHLSSFEKTYSFTTTGAGPVYKPDTAPNQQDIDEWLKQQESIDPIILLTHKTPYETDTFSISATYIDKPPDYFYFTINIKGPDFKIAQQDAFQWMKNLGLTEEQINNLDIRYQTSQ